MITYLAETEGGSMALQTLEALLAVSPTLAAIIAAAYFILRFQNREMKAHLQEIAYLQTELASERARNEAMDLRIEALTEEVRRLKDEVHELRRHVPDAS